MATKDSVTDQFTTITTQAVATMGIHSNTLPVTHIPMAHSQAVATKDLVTERFTTITTQVMTTMGIHSKTLPVTRIPMARTQVVATKDSVTDQFTTIIDVNCVLLTPLGKHSENFPGLI